MERRGNASEDGKQSRDWRDLQTFASNGTIKL
jgi:hypothetical protein